MNNLKEHDKNIANILNDVIADFTNNKQIDSHLWHIAIRLESLYTDVQYAPSYSFGITSSSNNVGTRQNVKASDFTAYDQELKRYLDKFKVTIEEGVGMGIPDDVITHDEKDNNISAQFALGLRKLISHEKNTNPAVYNLFVTSDRNAAIQHFAKAFALTAYNKEGSSYLDKLKQHLPL